MRQDFDEGHSGINRARQGFECGVAPTRRETREIRADSFSLRLLDFALSEAYVSRNSEAHS